MIKILYNGQGEQELQSVTSTRTSYGSMTWSGSFKKLAYVWLRPSGDKKVRYSDDNFTSYELCQLNDNLLGEK